MSRLRLVRQRLTMADELLNFVSRRMRVSRSNPCEAPSNQPLIP
jgi:hypothetical protein